MPEQRRHTRDPEKHRANSLKSYYANHSDISQRRKERRQLERAAKGIIVEPDELCQLVRELAYHCGLSTAQLRELRVTHIEPNGVRIPPSPKPEKPSRLAPFGNGRGELRKTILDAYISKEKPTDYLFFSRTPEQAASCEGCGCEFVKTRRTQRFHSSKCGQIARDRKRWSKRRNARLGGALLERYRSDPHWHQVGGDNFVVCRECGGPYQTLYGHMRDVHKMTLKEYHRKWPGAPWATENAKAKARQLAKRRRALEEPEKKKERYAKLRDKQRVYRATHVEELKQWRREKRKLRRDAINKRKREQRIALGIVKLDEINRKQCEKYAANREQRRAQQRGYRAADPERFRKYAQKSYAKHRTQRLDEAAKRRQVAWRPRDWKERSTDWRIIGTELLKQDYISNEDLGGVLGASRIVMCPEKYGKSWGAALSPDKRTNSKAATELVRQIRAWVGRPGKRGKSAQQESVITPP
jgi:hypothetical protein